MKAYQIVLVIVLALLAIVKSEENKRLEFLIQASPCKNAGEECSTENPCCEGLTCSEFKFCRN